MSKCFEGQVVKLAMQKTATIKVEYRQPHPLYKKIITKHAKRLVDVGEHALKVGAVVLCQDCRPLSKLKSARVIKIIREAK